jgi:cytochrome c556
MPAPARPLAAVGLAVLLLLAGCGGEAEQAVREAGQDARERVSALRNELAAEIESAKRQLEDLTPVDRQRVEKSLDDANQAAREAERALENTGDKVDDAARDRLEKSRAQLDQARQRLDDATAGLPAQLRDSMDGVRQRLQDVRDRVDDRLQR